jgi:Fe-S cluster biogenesis protein NfuA
MKTEQINDTTQRFYAGKTISQREFTLNTPQETVNSPLGKKLFGFPWTETVKIGTDFVELTKKEWVDWETLLEPLQGLLEEHFTHNEILEGAQAPVKSSLDSEEAHQVKQFINDSINPSLASHGGWVELKSLENNAAYLKMGGGCQGCGMSQITMIEGIESALKEQFPFVQRVIDMTDHSSGDNPYYKNENAQ